MMLPIDSNASFHCNSSVYTLLWVHQNQRYCKNRKESILKNPQSILEIGLTIADVGAKSANRGSTSHNQNTPRPKNVHYVQRITIHLGGPVTGVDSNKWCTSEAQGRGKLSRHINRQRGYSVGPVGSIPWPVCAARSVPSV